MTKNIVLTLKELCINNKITITSAESCTGGLLSSKITKIPGSSQYFDSGFVTYSNSSKCSLLGVSKKSINQYGSVSEQVAKEMAIGALQNSKAQYSISITGIAGPSSVGIKPEGLVWFGVANNHSVETTKRHFGPIGRTQVRIKSSNFAIKLLIKFIGLNL